MTQQSASVHLPPDLAKSVATAETKLKKKGVSRSQLLSDSIREGLPAVVKRLSQRKNHFSLLECVEEIVGGMNGDITRAKVIDVLKEDYPGVVKKYEATTLSANVAAYLRRLKDRDVLEENGTAEEPGAKGLRNYSVNVYRRKAKPKK